MGFWKELSQEPLPPPPVIKIDEKPLVPDPARMSKPLNERYKNVVFEGSTFPDDPYRVIQVTLNDTVKLEYLPALEIALQGRPKGLKLLCTAMTHQEGFTKKSRSYRTKNPGNVGNTDSGANRTFNTLVDGIKAQADHLLDISDGAKHYPMGSKLYLPPFYSSEIAKNPGYGLPANLPGYRFIYTGQLDQFVKVYSTGARATNNYLDTIVSYFLQNGLVIKPYSKLAEIVIMA